jgi:hypothetical protein
MAREWKPSADQEAALSVVVGYCFKEIYEMGTAFPRGHMCQLAAHEVVAMAGMSWPQFVSENAVRLELAPLDD